LLPLPASPESFLAHTLSFSPSCVGVGVRFLIALEAAAKTGKYTATQTSIRPTDAPTAIPIVAPREIPFRLGLGAVEALTVAAVAGVVSLDEELDVVDVTNDDVGKVSLQYPVYHD